MFYSSLSYIAKNEKKYTKTIKSKGSNLDLQDYSFFNVNLIIN